jgi:ubiquinone/menaquinone biosynthesis C-methylase UbiE
MPNDKPEQIRQLLVHEVYKGAFDNEPTSVPLENPTHILDIGAGTGEWAIDMADHYSDCEVTGTDIADVFPRFVAPNLFWEIDNAELEWIRAPDTYDLVHFRNMAGAFADWPFVYNQAFRVVKPGGWIELLDFDDHQGFRNFFSFFEEESPIHKIARELSEASLLSGRPRGVKHLEPELLHDAGFEDVILTEHAIPISPKEMTTGHLFLKALMEGMEATILRLLTTYKGWTAEQVRIACAMMSQELKEMALNRDRAKDFVVKVRVMTGRKPADAELLEPQPTFDYENVVMGHHVQEGSIEGNPLHGANAAELPTIPNSQGCSSGDRTPNHGNGVTS